MTRGFFGRGDMQKEFEEASFALEKGQVSKVVETASGLHLIQRFATRLPSQRFGTDLSRTDWNSLALDCSVRPHERTDREISSDMRNSCRVLRGFRLTVPYMPYRTVA